MAKEAVGFLVAIKDAMASQPFDHGTLKPEYGTFFIDLAIIGAGPVAMWLRSGPDNWVCVRCSCEKGELGGTV